MDTDRPRKALALIGNNPKRTKSKNDAPRKRQRISEVEAVVSEKAGKLKKLHLRNFMCHSNFQFSFKGGINFISGKNGSGKSALLTSLVIGLGGRTIDTNRGKNLSEIIKTGEKKCTIEVTLSNAGDLSFDNEKYGDEITIMRTITDKSSVFKLIPSNGPSIPLKSRDLKMLLLQFNIQSTNPLCILNQDTSRTFLKNATPKELYSYFCKATLIEAANLELKEMSQVSIPAMESVIKRRIELAQDICRDIDEYKQQEKEYNELLELKNKETQLQNRVNWAYVDELEDRFNNVKKIISDARADIEVKKSRYENSQSHHENLKDEINMHESDIRSLKETDNLKENEIEIVERKFVNTKDLINKKKTKLDQMKVQLAKENQACQVIQEAIENNIKNSQAIKEKLNKRQQKVKELTDRSAELQAVKKTSEVHKKQLQDTLNEIDSNIEFMKKKISDTERNLCTKKNYAQHLKNSSNNKYSIYAHWMPEMLKAIDSAYQRGKFVEKPIGPIGLFIKLKDKSWGPAIESYLGRRFLQGFCCYCNEDSDTLHNLFNQHNIYGTEVPSVTISKYLERVHDLRKHQVRHQDYSSLFSCLDITNSIVANVVIDNSDIETVLLIPDSKDAFPLMKNVEYVPQNCRLALTKKGDKIYPSPNYSAYSGRARDCKFLNVSADDAIKSTEAELLLLNQTLKDLNNNLHALKNKQNSSKKLLDNSLKEISDINRQILICEDKLQEIKDQDEPLDSNNVHLEEDLKYRKTVVENASKNKEQLKKDIEQNINLARELLATKKKLESQRSAIIIELKEKQGAINKIKNDIRDYELNQDNLRESLNLAQAKCKQFEEKIVTIENETKYAIEIASKECPNRLPAGQIPKEELETKLKKITIARLKMEKTVKKPVKPKLYEERLLEYQKIRENTDLYAKQLKELTAQCRRTTILLSGTREKLTKVTRSAFNSIMKMRNFNATLIMNHERETLELDLQTGDSQAKTVITTLSGGERSFSMVAFILSLWTNMGCPFFIMDEFDVFMDEVNRKIIIDILMWHARLHSSNQFIFLTPHATYNDTAKDVYNFRMDDPRR